MQAKRTTMATIDELKILREKEDHVEFKRAKHNFPFAGGDKSDIRERRKCVLGYVVALANEKGGRLILGMEDAYPHVVVGSDFAIGETGALEDEIYERLHIRIRTEELYDDSGLRVLVFNVPSRPIGKALRFEGVPLMRIGDSLREMDDAEYLSIISEQDPDFSAKICEGLTIDDLDPQAVQNMRKRIADQRNRKDILTLPLTQLLHDLLLIDDDGKLKYATLLLLGKEEAIMKYLPQANVVIEYRNSHSQVRYAARQEYRLPLFVAIDKIWDYINQPASNPLLHINNLPQIIDCPAFNKETVREAVINAMIHRSLQMNSDIFIKIFPDMLEISNPGGFPFGVNIGNILTINSSPRSRLMAEAIEKTGLIERSGQGVDTMFINCIKEGKPLPDYSFTDDYQVNLRLYAQIPDDAFYLFAQDICQQADLLQELNVFDWLALHFVWKSRVDAATTESLEKLEKMNLLVKDDYFGYTLGERYLLFKPNVRAAAEDINLNLILRVYNVTRRKGDAAMSEYVSALDGILTQKQVRNLITSLIAKQLLKPKGNARATRYIWIG